MLTIKMLRKWNIWSMFSHFLVFSAHSISQVPSSRPVLFFISPTAFCGCFSVYPALEGPPPTRSTSRPWTRYSTPPCALRAAAIFHLAFFPRLWPGLHPIRTSPPPLPSPLPPGEEWPPHCGQTLRLSAGFICWKTTSPPPSLSAHYVSYFCSLRWSVKQESSSNWYLPTFSWDCRVIKGACVAYQSEICHQWSSSLENKNYICCSFM